MPSIYSSRQNSPDLINRLVRLIVAAFLLTVSSPSWADAAIVPDSEAVQHIGESVTVEGVVWGVIGSFAYWLDLTSGSEFWFYWPTADRQLPG